MDNYVVCRNLKSAACSTAVYCLMVALCSVFASLMTLTALLVFTETSGYELFKIAAIGGATGGLLGGFFCALPLMIKINNLTYDSRECFEIGKNCLTVIESKPLEELRTKEIEIYKKQSIALTDAFSILKTLLLSDTNNIKHFVVWANKHTPQNKNIVFSEKTVRETMTPEFFNNLESMITTISKKQIKLLEKEKKKLDNNALESTPLLYHV
jgi:hypothetical protein